MIYAEELDFVAENASFAERYRSLNSSFKNPIRLNLSQRGHYSEVNCLIAVMVYGLIHRRRVIVDDASFEGIKWGELYRSRLPIAPHSVVDNIDPAWDRLKDGDQRFSSIRRRVHRHSIRRLPVWAPKLGILSSVRRVSKILADEFCKPTISALPLPFDGPYAAFHIRRGDKILGSLVDGERTPPEGQDIPMTTYLTALRREAPGIRAVWVMTDDYRAVAELRALAPDVAFETMCDPEASGYEQTQFTALPVESKLMERRRLIAETEVAIKSSVFVGAFSSNVDRFIALRHPQPKACYSVDREKRWYPA
jgi:hypothetical protein